MATTQNVKDGFRAVYDDVKDLGYMVATWETVPSNWFDSRWTRVTYSIGGNAVFLDTSMWIANQVQERGLNYEDLYLYSLGVATLGGSYLLNRGIKGIGLSNLIETETTKIEGRAGLRNVWYNSLKRIAKGVAAAGAVAALWHYGNNLGNKPDVSLWEDVKTSWQEVTK